MTWGRHSRLLKRVMGAAGGDDDPSAPRKVRRQETHQEIVGQVVDCEGQLVAVGALARTYALDPGVQHQCVDRPLIEQPRCKTSDAVEAREINRLQVCLMLEHRWRGARVPRCNDQPGGAPAEQPLYRFKANAGGGAGHHDSHGAPVMKRSRLPGLRNFAAEGPRKAESEELSTATEEVVAMTSPHHDAPLGGPAGQVDVVNLDK